MVKTCILCKKYYSTKEQRSFHVLPRNEERKRKWIKILNLQSPSKSTYICSDHFNKEDIVLDVADRAKLKIEATPLPYYAVLPEIKVEYVEGEIETPVAGRNNICTMQRYAIKRIIIRNFKRTRISIFYNINLFNLTMAFE